MKRLVACLTTIFLASCGNPGGISDADYAKYEELGAPKILYSCTRTLPADFGQQLQCISNGGSVEHCKKEAEETAKDNSAVEVNLAAGVGAAVTYNQLLQEAKSACEAWEGGTGHGTFKVLESQQ